MNVLTNPHVHLWTLNEYHRMAELGFFRSKRVQLIEGQIINMGPMGSEQATSVALAAKTLERAFGSGYFVRCQMPLSVGALSEPEPDMAVIAGDIRDYASAHPNAAVLIVEVADSSLVFDRTEKASLYGKSGMIEYWIVNLVDRHLEVCRRPIQEAQAPFGFIYTDRTILKTNDRATPLAAPHLSIAVADLLP